MLFRSKGVEINPNVNGKELTKSGLDRFFAAAEKLGAVIFMHPIGYTDGGRLMDHYFNNVIGNPLETTVATAHLIFDGVMERHPKLKVVLHTPAATSRITGRAWTTPGRRVRTAGR